MVMFKKTKLINAVRHDDVQGARMLLEKGAPANGSEGLHPIILLAIERQNREMTELLLAHGADINAACENHGNAIDVLQGKKPKADFIAFLLEKEPAFLDQTGRFGATPSGP